MITKLKAEQIAQIEVNRLASMSIRKKREYNQIEFLKETENTFVFFAACPSLIAQDVAPGGIVVHIDKIDGHIWQQNEFDLKVKHTQQLQAA